MQTRHPARYGQQVILQEGEGQVFEASEDGVTMAARNITPAELVAFKASPRGGVIVNRYISPSADDFFVEDASTGGVKINPDLLP